MARTEAGHDYTTRHWVAKPGYEAELAAGFQRADVIAKPFVIARYIWTRSHAPGTHRHSPHMANTAKYDARVQYADMQ
jgi:hypothetical protein